MEILALCRERKNQPRAVRKGWDIPRVNEEPQREEWWAPRLFEEMPKNRRDIE